MQFCHSNLEKPIVRTNKWNVYKKPKERADSRTSLEMIQRKRTFVIKNQSGANVWAMEASLCCTRSKI